MPASNGATLARNRYNTDFIGSCFDLITAREHCGRRKVDQLNRLLRVRRHGVHELRPPVPQIVVKRVPSEQTQNKPPEHDRPHREQRISDNAHPTQLVHQSDCMNSADRAYQVPCSIDAHACSSPTGSMLRRTMKTKPELIDQNAIESGRSFHAGLVSERAGRRASVRVQAFRRRRTEPCDHARA